MTPLTIDIPLELTVTLTAAHQRISPGMSDTGQSEDIIEDIAISALLYDHYEFSPPDSGTTSGTYHRIRTDDLLADVDTSNPHVQQLLSNILACVQSAAEEGFLAEVGE